MFTLLVEVQCSILKKVRGWLANSDRKVRRDRANTFTNQDAFRLIKKIDSIENPGTDIIAGLSARARMEISL